MTDELFAYANRTHRCPDCGGGLAGWKVTLRFSGRDECVRLLACQQCHWTATDSPQSSLPSWVLHAAGPDWWKGAVR